ncbi:MAG: peroxiredoxin [Thermomicrobiales bacterium]
MDYSVPDVGDDAPDFTLVGSTGEPVTLSQLRRSQRAVLIFYPRDFTSGCQSQLAAASEGLDEFRAVDAQPFGINFGDSDSHLRFRSSLGLPFDLLVDDELVVSRAFGVLKPDPEKPGEFLNSINRTVIVVGKNGKIIYRRAGAPPVEEIVDAIKAAEDE